MKWFKHDSDAGNDAKLRKLRLKYGAQGYGIYWYCLELIARNVEKHNLTFELEHDALLIADDFKLSGEFVQEMMAYMVDLGLFENTQGVITCLKMSTRTDEYTAKLISQLRNSPDKLQTPSGENPRMSELIEENRTDKNSEKNQKTILRVCHIFKENKITGFSSIHPVFQELINQGVTAEEFENAAINHQGKKFNYIVGVVKGVRNDAANLKLTPKEDKQAWLRNVK